ncbi:unnamed protein product [Rotaria sp. Silwood2]|nr:unnamed protein product [Rotaria sp. Silwood2]
MLIKDDNVQRELIQYTKYLPMKYIYRIKAAEVNEEEPNIILRLDDDLTTTMTEGIAVKQTVNQTDVVDFDAETEID